MKIAVVSSTKPGETDLLLAKAAEQLQVKGAVLAGIVKDLEYVAGYDNGCDMKVRVLPDGPVIRITQSLGKGSDACRLDPSAIVTAVSTVENSDLTGADLFILNKFGPEEAAGRGFRTVIGAALEQGIPVLVGVGASSRDAFDTFVDGLAVTVSPDEDAIQDWCIAAMSKDDQVENT
jgi:hypothetical protein